jgi:hypothetical protein
MSDKRACRTLAARGNAQSVLVVASVLLAHISDILRRFSFAFTLSRSSFKNRLCLQKCNKFFDRPNVVCNPASIVLIQLARTLAPANERIMALAG